MLSQPVLSLINKIKQFFEEKRRLIFKGISRRTAAIAGLIACLLLSGFYHLYASATETVFEDGGKIIKISSGDQVSLIGIKLEESSIIRQSSCFVNFLKLLGKDDEVVSGSYVFKKPVSCLNAISRITNGKYELNPIKVTIVEGLNTSEIAQMPGDNLPGFNSIEFASIARIKEGYLFPDTYMFFPNASPEDVINKMEDDFKQKTESISVELEVSKRSLKDVVIMASIIEDEAITEADRRVVSGILWKRLKLGMPLQVDAPFRYIDGKGTFDLTDEDLATSSPYNTYKYKGLPPTPISNPGLDSILAAINPTKTDYLYFISDKKGKMYYAKTFDEHQTNRELYLGR